MKDRESQFMTVFALVIFLLLGLFVVEGCKKKQEQTESTTGSETAAKAEQKICPVMGGAINNDIFIEYKGKKVYFCCPECIDKFEKKPEKYLDKLPQFEN